MENIYTEYIDQYTYSCCFDKCEKEYLATVEEFPYLSAFADTQEKAIVELKKIIEDIIIDCCKNKRSIIIPKGVNK